MHFSLDLGTEARPPALEDFIASPDKSKFLGRQNRRSLSHDASGPFSQTPLHLLPYISSPLHSLTSAMAIVAPFPSKPVGSFTNILRILVSIGM